MVLDTHMAGLCWATGLNTVALNVLSVVRLLRLAVATKGNSCNCSDYCGSSSVAWLILAGAGVILLGGEGYCFPGDHFVVCC